MVVFFFFMNVHATDAHTAKVGITKKTNSTEKIHIRAHYALTRDATDGPRWTRAEEIVGRKSANSWPNRATLSFRNNAFAARTGRRERNAIANSEKKTHLTDRQRQRRRANGFTTKIGLNSEILFGNRGPVTRETTRAFLRTQWRKTIVCG